jgi:iron complex outermembrane recepter protein
MAIRPEAPSWLRLIGGFIVAASVTLSPQVLSQDVTDDENDADDAREEIVVTGSRLKRDTYTSIAPLQVITGQVSREVGLIDAADILQESSASSGQQIDLTFQGFVLDNGPGATTVDLRGLGAARTLVLINGRRVAPAGVEGAPVAADLGLVPASLVQQYDLLLDGASSVYGSDAVAGVANIIMRKDFDGFEFEAYSRVPHHSNGVEHTMSAVWGRNFDRGFIGVGAEWVDSERVSFDDRPWTAGCEKNAEIDQYGQVRTQDQFYSNVFGMAWDECSVGLVARRVFVPLQGSVYYTPGTSSGGWPNFSPATAFGTFGVDGNGDGQTDLSFRDYSLNGRTQHADLFPDVEQQSVMAYGEYTFAGEANITPFFEVLYARRDFFSDFGEIQFFPQVPANNPFNICNPAAVGGVDCGLAWDGFVNNPNVVNQVLAAFGCDPSSGGSCDQTVGAIGPQISQPIVSVRGDRNLTDVTGDQIRYVAGVRSDLPFMTRGSLNNWTMELAGVYSKSTAESHRLGIRNDRLNLALGWYSTTNTPCENNVGQELESDVAPGCVPVNMFAPSLYPEGVIGDFGTPAEREYLFDSRDFDTEYEQTLFSYYMTGNVFEVPAGPIAIGLGVEHRTDEIKSIPDAVARDGLFFGFFSDGGAVGKKTTKEAFGEIELPILAGMPGAEELTLNLSGRLTNDEYYGTESTYSYKLAYRPVESLLVRGTFGTSYRAPNLRELFLQAQTGFLSLFDPCLIPDGAFDPISGTYIPANDNRDPRVLANCLAEGVDPTVANNNGFNIYSMEVAAGGSLTLDEETSKSWSAGFSWDQPFTNAFELSMGVTYYSIDIDNTIIEPNGQFIINDCYTSTTGNSVFCDRIQRDLSDPASPLIDFIDRGFINRDNEKARGVDINIAFDDEVTVFERPVALGVDLWANRQLERSTLFVDVNGNPDSEEFKGEWGFPDWKFRLGMRADFSDWRVTWETNYLGSVEQDQLAIDDFDDIGGIADTCLGPPTDVLCRNIGFTGDYFLHNTSLYYYGDRWTFGGGIRNVFDRKPPFVDGAEVLSINNTPIGYGYDLRGRTYFVNVQANFGGGG